MSATHPNIDDAIAILAEIRTARAAWCLRYPTFSPRFVIMDAARYLQLDLAIRTQATFGARDDTRLDELTYSKPGIPAEIFDRVLDLIPVVIQTDGLSFLKIAGEPRGEALRSRERANSAHELAQWLRIEDA